MAEADILESVRRLAQQRETPCGRGALVWRRWGRGRPVVLLHGGSGSWMHWIHTIPALMDRFEVWAPDLPGLGDSAMPDDPPTPETSAAAVVEGFRAIFDDGLKPDLVGFSFGAHVGTIAASMLGDALRSFTLSGSAALGLPHRKLDFARERAGMTAAERDEVHRANLALLMFADPARIDALAIRIQSQNIAKARFKSRAFAPTDGIRRLLPELAIPVRALWGEHDNIADGDVAGRIALLQTLRPGLPARLVPDAGHWAAYEQADRYAALLCELLDLPT
jgi:pimeloyl-ACP methyl ester carboxylesterase